MIWAWRPSDQKPICKRAWFISIRPECACFKAITAPAPEPSSKVQSAIVTLRPLAAEINVNDIRFTSSSLWSSRPTPRPDTTTPIILSLNRRAIITICIAYRHVVPEIGATQHCIHTAKVCMAGIVNDDETRPWKRVAMTTIPTISSAIDCLYCRRADDVKRQPRRCERNLRENPVRPLITVLIELWDCHTKLPVSLHKHQPNIPATPKTKRLCGFPKQISNGVESLNLMEGCLQPSSFS